MFLFSLKLKLASSSDEGDEKMVKDIEDKKDDEQVSKIMDDIFGGESDSEGHANDDNVCSVKSNFHSSPMFRTNKS